MAEITARRMGELVRGMFKILLAEPQGLLARDVLARLVDEVPPTPFEQATYPKSPTVRRFEKIARFSTIGPVKAGWLVKEKGQWVLTEEGKQAYAKFKDPEGFFKEARRLYRLWRDERDGESEPEDEQDEEQVEATGTLEEVEDTAWAQVQERLAKMDPYKVQDLVAGLLEGMGHHIVWNAPPGKDGGIDVIAQTDALGVSGPRIKVQVKRKGDPVPVGPIREFLSSLTGSDVGLFFATGGFTSDAELAARQATQHLTLLDARRFFDLWVKHYGSIPEERQRLLPWKAIYFPLPVK